MAAQTDCVECIRLLLQAAADPGLKNANGDMAPLSNARSLESVKLRVEHGVEVNAVDSERASALSRMMSSRTIDAC